MFFSLISSPKIYTGPYGLCENYHARQELPCTIFRNARQFVLGDEFKVHVICIIFFIILFISIGFVIKFIKKRLPAEKKEQKSFGIHFEKLVEYNLRKRLGKQHEMPIEDYKTALRNLPTLNFSEYILHYPNNLATPVDLSIHVPHYYKEKLLPKLLLRIIAKRKIPFVNDAIRLFTFILKYTRCPTNILHKKRKKQTSMKSKAAKPTNKYELPDIGPLSVDSFEHFPRVIEDISTQRIVPPSGNLINFEKITFNVPLSNIRDRQDDLVQYTINKDEMNQQVNWLQNTCTAIMEKTPEKATMPLDSKLDLCDETETEKRPIYDNAEKLELMTKGNKAESLRLNWARHKISQQLTRKHNNEMQIKSKNKLEVNFKIPLFKCKRGLSSNRIQAERRKTLKRISEYKKRTNNLENRGENETVCEKLKDKPQTIAMKAATHEITVLKTPKNIKNSIFKRKKDGFSMKNLKAFLEPSSATDINLREKVMHDNSKLPDTHEEVKPEISKVEEISKSRDPNRKRTQRTASVLKTMNSETRGENETVCEKLQDKPQKIAMKPATHEISDLKTPKNIKNSIFKRKRDGFSMKNFKASLEPSSATDINLRKKVKHENSNSPDTHEEVKPEISKVEEISKSRDPYRRQTRHTASVLKTMNSVNEQKKTIALEDNDLCKCQAKLSEKSSTDTFIINEKCTTELPTRMSNASLKKETVLLEEHPLVGDETLPQGVLESNENKNRTIAANKSSVDVIPAHEFLKPQSTVPRSAKKSNIPVYTRKSTPQKGLNQTDFPRSISNIEKSFRQCLSVTMSDKHQAYLSMQNKSMPPKKVVTISETHIPQVPLQRSKSLNTIRDDNKEEKIMNTEMEKTIKWYNSKDSLEDKITKALSSEATLDKSPSQEITQMSIYSDSNNSSVFGTVNTKISKEPLKEETVEPKVKAAHSDTTEVEDEGKAINVETDSDEDRPVLNVGLFPRTLTSIDRIQRNKIKDEMTELNDLDEVNKPES